MTLRQKFVLSFSLLTAGLTCATLLTVRRTAEERVRLEVKQEALNSVRTFQVIAHQHQVALSRKADLLASLALMRNGEATALKDVAEDPWQSEECDLLALADPKGKIIAVHTTTSKFDKPAAQEMFELSLKEGGGSGWWYSGSRLYQVVLQPFYDEPEKKKNLVGTVIVGHGIDPSANELGSVSSSQMVFQYGDDVVAGTLAPFKVAEFARQLKTGPLTETVKIDGERYYAMAVNLTSGPKPVRFYVLKSYDEALAYLAKERRMLAALGLLAVLAGGSIVFLIANRFTRPLWRLVDGVQALERGDFEYPLDLNGADEVAQVTRAFDRMRGTLKNNEREQLELQEQLRKTQKMEAIGRLAGGVAHDFNNLLTVIKGHGDLILDRLQPTDSLYGNAHQIEKATNSAAALTRQLLAFSRMQVLQPKVLNINTLLSEIFSILKRLVREDISFTFRAGESLARINADPGQIEQVIMNLVVNASDAMPRGGKLVLETENAALNEAFCRTHTPLLPGNYVCLSVDDTGHGMDPATLARIFEPFFTTKEQGKGTGLGLATVYGIVKQSGGCIWVDSKPGKGTRFEVYFPQVLEREDGPTAQKERSEATSENSEVVLIVEDEDQVRELAAEFARSAGYTVLTARDGKDALSVCKRFGEPIHALLTDVVMPNMRGPELAKRLKSKWNDVRIIYMSGYLEYNKGNGDFMEDEFFLQKPFSRISLIAKVGEALKEQRQFAN